MRIVYRLALACFMVALAALYGCGGAHNTEPPQRVDRSVITADMIRDQHFEDAYKVVEALRSNWLRERGQDSFASPSVVLVYFDNVKMGDVSTLRGINPQTVAEIRRYDAVEATARWGIGHGAGVIAVTSWAARKQPPTPDTTAVRSPK